ncbi:rRNA N(6)-adenosine-methyltransferase ZCCHC4 [Synchiropus picturatus]
MQPTEPGSPVPDSSGPESVSWGFEVILDGNERTPPCCPHGPTLLFEKVCKGGKNGRRFYACAACRDRKDCNFFQWEDEKVSAARLLARETENKLKSPPFTQLQYNSRFQKLASLPLDQKKFCQDCQLMLLPGELATHATHRNVAVTAAHFNRPSMLLRPLQDKKTNAQYLFTDRASQFLLNTLVALGFRKILCVGAPRLLELTKIRNQEQVLQLKSLLLDIDLRYAQFYSRDEFCHYNMFNHHCFAGEASSSVLQDFLSEADGEKVVMVADPPFGGLVKPLAHSFYKISEMWKKQQSSDGEIPMMWVFPYFFEPRILECLPSLTMLDYQVDYDNHPLYKHGKTGRKQSPVRIFTNIPAKDVVLPKEEGYRFCSTCERFVCSLNKHCAKCNTCPSKDGREWKHCSACDKCVKPSWRHCRSCGRCALPDHPCEQSQGTQGCFICGSLQHKRSVCPQKRSDDLKSKTKSGRQRQAKMKGKMKFKAARKGKKISV